jgi:hypothetical protein
MATMLRACSRGMFFENSGLPGQLWPFFLPMSAQRRVVLVAGRRG